jgi:hypothetical protein
MQRRLFSRLVSILLALTLVQLLQLSMNLPAQAATSQLDSGALTQTRLTPNSYTFYGSNHSWMLAATNDWYQHQGNWCGIANIRAIQVYDWLYYNGKAPGWDNSQEAIHNRLNSYSSPWGHGSGGYVYSDIAGDGGTDPHSIAYGAWYDTPPSSQNQPYWFHNWIYRTSSTTATYDFSTDFGKNTVSHNDPISVTIDGGFHSFVVDGVWATSDPSYPGATIGSIDTWDPWLNHANQSRDGTHPYNQTENQVWSLTDWTTNRVMWGQGYNTHNGFDPDPDTSNHYYVPPFNSYGVPYHWNTYFVTIEQDRINNNSTSFDYAIDQNGHLAPHN